MIDFICVCVCVCVCVSRFEIHLIGILNVFENLEKLHHEYQNLLNRNAKVMNLDDDVFICKTLPT